MKLTVKPGSADWLALRKTKVTATDVGVILGLNPHKSRAKLLKQKLDVLPADPDNEAMAKGRELEPFARAVYEELTGEMLSQACYISDEHPWAMCSPDGVYFDQSKGLEIKCSEKLYAYAMEDIIPDMYYAQCQHCMFVTGAKTWDYMAYWEPKESYVYKIITLERNDEFIEKIIRYGKEFYDELVNTSPDELGLEIREDKEWERLVRDYLYTKAQSEVYAKVSDTYRKELIALSNGKECIGAGIRLTKSKREGNISYKDIPELMSLDLDKYRKPSTEVWTIRNVSEEGSE